MPQPGCLALRRAMPVIASAIMMRAVHANRGRTSSMRLWHHKTPSRATMTAIIWRYSKYPKPMIRCHGHGESRAAWGWCLAGVLSPGTEVPPSPHQIRSAKSAMLTKGGVGEGLKTVNPRHVGGVCRELPSSSRVSRGFPDPDSIITAGGH
jgi:hypothetical protein